MQRNDSFPKTLMLGKTEGGRRRGGWDGWWHCWLNGHEFQQTPGDSEGEGNLACCMQSMGSQRVRHDWETTELKEQISSVFCFFVVVAVVYVVPLYPPTQYTHTHTHTHTLTHTHTHTHTHTEFLACNERSIIVRLDWAELNRFKLNTKHSEMH